MAFFYYGISHASPTAPWQDGILSRGCVQGLHEAADTLADLLDEAVEERRKEAPGNARPEAFDAVWAEADTAQSAADRLRRSDYVAEWQHALGERVFGSAWRDDQPAKNSDNPAAKPENVRPIRSARSACVEIPSATTSALEEHVRCGTGPTRWRRGVSSEHWPAELQALNVLSSVRCWKHSLHLKAPIHPHDRREFHDRV